MRQPLAITRVLVLAFCLQCVPLALCAESSSPDLNGILHYISTGWSVLTRSMDKCKSFGDPKLLEGRPLF